MEEGSKRKRSNSSREGPSSSGEGARGYLLCVLSWLIAVRLIERERRRNRKEKERERDRR